MADYVVRLTGQDNLSNTVKQVKKELSDVGNVGQTAMDKINVKVDRITKSSAPLKRQLRDLQAIMAEMNFKGLSNTPEFTQIAQQAGRIKDAIADASTATQKFSSDTMKLNAAIQALQGVAAAANVAVGAMALFGTENEEAAKMIQKVQGALAILNGVQAIANTLNKDSALMHRIKQIQLAANTKATVQDTVATTANSTAKALNTASVAANTSAQKAWNTTKAIGKALLGDWTGLLLVGVAGLTAYSMATTKSTNAQDELNTSTKKGQEIQSQYVSTLGSTYSQLMTKYTQLRTEWNKLSNDHQKAQWIKQNKSQLNELEISVNNVADAEKAFNGNTDAVVQAFVKRAKAAARLAQLTELYRKQIELIDKRNQTATQIQADAARSGRFANAGDEITDETFRSSRYGSVSSDGKWRFSEQGAKLYSGTDTSSNKVIQTIDSEIDGVNRQIGKVVDAIQAESTVPIISSGGGSASTNRSTSNSTTDKKEIIKGSLTDLENQLNVLQTKLKDGLIAPDKVEETKVKVEELKDEILKKKIQLGLEIDPKLKEDEEAKKKIIDEVNKWFEGSKNNITLPEISSFEKATNVNPYDDKTLDGIQNLMDYNDSLISKLEETRQKLLQLQQALKDAGLEGSEAFNEVTDELEKTNGSIDNVNQQQKDLGKAATEVSNDKKQLEEQSEAWGYYSEMLGAATNAVSLLGDSQEAQMAQFALNTASIIANAVSTIAAMNAEALAKGASSAFSLPFPANLAAWATIATTIGSIFASLPKFADGGIVSGTQHGDNVIARLNGDEMVLNARQQSNLFKAIDNGTFEFGSTDNGNSTINFKIKGSDLYGTLKNFSKTAAKSGRITGIK